MLNAVTSTISGGTIYSTNYDASQGTLAETQQGAADVINYISNGLQNCPSQKYVLLGYSLGASVNAIAMNRFNNTGSAAYMTIVASLTEGTPAHETGKLSNVDENGGAETRNCRGFQYYGNQRREIVSNAWYDSGKYLDVCVKGDTLCCCPADPAFAGFCAGSIQHLLYNNYVKTVQAMGAKFVIAQLQ